MQTETLCHTLCQLNAAADGHKVQIGAWTPQHQIAHVASDDIYLASHPVGHLADKPKRRILKLFPKIHDSINSKFKIQNSKLEIVSLK